MPARTGQQYLAGPAGTAAREVWFRGERVKDVTTHPGLARARARSRRCTTCRATRRYRDADDLHVAHGPASRWACRSSFRARKRSSKARRVMMLNWARTTCGMMGRSPDFMNVTLRRLGRRRGLFRRRESRNSARTCADTTIISRENDLVLTHSLINLQRSRDRLRHVQPGGRHRAAGGEGDLRRPDGAEARACWRRSGRSSDEIAVYSPRLGAAHRERTARSR